MGLAAPRKRVKLSHDPNNTKWTRDTGGFGHKIMTAQGWQPGDILGAKNASHAQFHTAANVSHIRVLVKDDNLGLGAKKGSGLGEGECTGLDVFQSLLGRLNGKDEDELLKEQKSRDDLKRALYTERRWGSVHFVKGGFLIGDKIQELIDNEEDRIHQLAQEPLGAAREAAESDLSRSLALPALERLVKKDKKKKKRQRKLEDLASDSPEESPSARPKESKRNMKLLEEAKEDPGASGNQKEDVSLETKTKTKTKKKGKEKKGKKRKEGKGSKQVVNSGDATADQTTLSRCISSTSGSSTPQSLLGGRHAVRSRNIAQKRLAVLDTASLNQIFMIKQ